MQLFAVSSLEEEVELSSEGDRDNALLGLGDGDEREQLQEDVEESKRDFAYIMSEVKEATQEAISQRTIRDYTR